MNVDDLNYYIVHKDNREEAAMFDGLISRVIGADAFNVFKEKRRGSARWVFGFWATEQEHADIMRTMKRVLEPDWDRDYEELFEDV